MSEPSQPTFLVSAYSDPVVVQINGKANYLNCNTFREFIEKMVAGRLNKYLGEQTLLGQPFVRDADITVGKLLEKSGAKVTRFCRFEVGEGMEKKSSDFAAEVMAQTKGG